MRRAFVLSCAIASALWSASADAAQWERVDRGLTETALVAVAADPSLPRHVFVASRSALYESTDAGATWQPRFRARGEARITSLALSRTPSPTLLLATDRALWITRDAGRQWHEAHLPPAAREILHATIDPQTPDRVYVVTTQRALAGRLTDGQWKTLFTLVRTEESSAETPAATDAADAPPLVSSDTLRALAVDPQEPSTLYLATARALRHSTDAGAHWQQIIPQGLVPVAIGRLAAVAHSPTVIYATTARGIARYLPAAQRWQRMKDTLTPSSINDLAVTDTQLWAATETGLYRFELTPQAFEPFAEDARPAVLEALESFGHEPTVAQVRDAAIRYAEVHPGKIAQWRRHAALKALLPTVNFGVTHTRSRNAHVDEGTFPRFQLIDTENQDANADVSVKWDLGDLIWNNDQMTIDVRSKLMVQLRDEIVDQVTRTYFERRRLQVALLAHPPEQPEVLIEKELRLQELTAMLDGFTGGYFSEHMKEPTTTQGGTPWRKP